MNAVLQFLVQLSAVLAGFTIPALIAYCSSIRQTTKAENSDFLQQVIHVAHEFKEACLQVWNFRDQSHIVPDSQRINRQFDALANMNRLIGTLMAHEKIAALRFKKRAEPLLTAMQQLRCFRFDDKHWAEWFGDLDSKLASVKDEASALWDENAALLPKVVRESVDQAKTRWGIYNDEWKNVSPAS